ncbi:MAG: response regulator transcription factor [bacterium]|jgi:DNA-binding NarL/FixJ family response regulator|nr:response regulator transcription factor [bacterium]MDD4557701.1 response regulator transcription factor [bacterium]
MDGIRLLIADDHPLMREGIQRVLSEAGDISVIGVAKNGMDAVEMARSLDPDVIIMDISMPELSGVEATRQIKKECPRVAVLILTVYQDNEHIFEAIKAGASGYILKDIVAERLVEAVRMASVGEALVEPTIASKLLEEFSNISNYREAANVFDELTTREIEILQAIADGHGNKDVAASLFISEKTVKNHLSNIFKKLQVNDRTQAVLLALRRGLINMD